MPLKILVPLNRVQQALKTGLVLDYPHRCSRCGAVPAEHYETHRLNLRIGQKRAGLYRQTYRVSQPYRLKIKVCEACYRTDFVTSIEELEKDNTGAGRLARLYNASFTVGGAIACVGLLLMTNIIQSESALGSVKAYWPYIVGSGGFIILAAWMHQRYSIRKELESLESAGIIPAERPRAEARTPVLDNENDPLAVPLEISLKDEAWAAECAEYYHYDTVNYIPGVP